MHTCTFLTNYGPITFEIWDTSGQEKLGSLRDAYYSQGDCAIIMVDVISTKTFENISDYCDDIRRVRETIPIVLVGNMIDMLPTEGMGDKERRKLRNNKLPYFRISALNNIDCEKPMLYLARMVTQKEELHFV